MPKPPYAEAQWYEVHYRSPREPVREFRIDRRRRTKATCERIVAEMRASGNYLEVWLVEVNRLSRGLNPWKMRRG
jgi:hypothetical protein